MKYTHINEDIKVYRKKLPNKNQRLNDLNIEIHFDGISHGFPLDLAVKECHKIFEESDGSVTVMVSGGVDSQAMLYAWVVSGLPFKAVHVVYDHGMNNSDTKSIFNYATSLGVDLEIKHFGVLQFLHSDEYHRMAKKYDCYSPHILTYIKMTESLTSGSCVMSGNFYSPGSPGFSWSILGLLRYRNITRRNFIPFFFINNVALYMSFSLLEEEKKLEIQETANKFDIGDFWYSQKCALYSVGGFKISPQQCKMTGFENYKKMYDAYYVPSRIKMEHTRMPSKRPFDIILRYETQKILPKGKYTDSYSVVIAGNDSSVNKTTTDITKEL